MILVSDINFEPWLNIQLIDFSYKSFVTKMSNDSTEWPPINAPQGVTPAPQLKPLEHPGGNNSNNNGIISYEEVPWGSSIPRLASPRPAEDFSTPFGGAASPQTREDQPSFGNSLSIHGISPSDGPVITPQVETDGGVPQSVDHSPISSDVQPTVPNVPPSSDVVVPLLLNQRDPTDQNSDISQILLQSPNSYSNRVSFVFESNSSGGNNQTTTNATPSSPTATSTQANNSSSVTTFPQEPTILADKYVVLGPVDASTCYGISLRTHETVHVKVRI